MQGGYGRKTKLLPPLRPQKEPDERERETQLQEEVRKLDRVLKTDNLTEVQGLIFTQDKKGRLAEDLLTSIKKRHRLVGYGFKVWQAGEKPAMVPAPIHPQLSFKQRLDQMSVQKIEQFDQAKGQHCLRGEQKWKVARVSQHCIKKHQQPLNISTLSHQKTQHSDQPSELSKRFTPSNLIGNKRLAKKVLTQPALEQEEREGVTLEAMEKMLQKGEGLVSIWLPPCSYPQFFGVVVPSVALTKSQGVRCRIRKYILFRQSISARLLEGLLQYLSMLFGVEIERLELIVKREDFRSHFEKVGCKVESWEGVNKVSISYKRALPL